MGFHISAIYGRGFPGAIPPELRASLYLFEDDGQGGLKGTSRTIDCARRPIRNSVGDFVWKVHERSISWPMKAELEISVVNIGAVRVRLDGQEIDDIQGWIPIRDEDELMIQIFVEEIPCIHDEKRRHERRLRIQKRQLEIDILRGISPNELEAWKKKRQTRAAKTIQSAWRSLGSRCYPKTCRSDLRAIDSTLVKRGNLPSVTAFFDQLRGSRDDSLHDRTHDSDSSEESYSMSPEDEIRMEEIERKIAANAKEKIGGDLGSMQKIYQSIIETNLELDEKLLDIQKIEEERKTRRENRRYSLRSLAHSQRMLSQDLRKPLEQYFRASTADEYQSIRADARRSSWFSKNKELQQKALNAHAEVLRQKSDGSDWWRVQSGDLEVDIRDAKASSPPWQYPFLIESELSKESEELSKLWLSYSRKPYVGLDANFECREGQKWKFENEAQSIDSVFNQILSELKEKNKSHFAPLFVAITSCPSHRLSSLYASLQDLTPNGQDDQVFKHILSQ